MNRLLTLVFAILTVTFVGACTKTYNFRTEHPEVLQVTEVPSDFKIPNKVWDLIEGEASNVSILYAPIKVFLTEKNERILQSPAYVFEFPRGGGTIDLSNFTTGQAGSFFVGFELPEEFKEGINLKVLYVSGARKRRIEDRVYGSGCNQVLDITKAFSEGMKTEGIRVNTTRNRHLSVLAGRYIFSIQKDSQIFITQVTLTDTQNKQLLCEALQ